MSGRVSAFLPVAGDPSAVRDRFLGDAGAWLPAGRPHGPDRWLVALRYRGISRTVEVHIGGVWTVGATVWRSVSWHPVPDEGDVGPIDRLLPELVGELGVHTGGGGASLVLSGTYDPPGAVIGEIADAILLHRVAERTARSFLEDLAPLLAGATVDA